jgi:hypothetical protein
VADDGFRSIVTACLGCPAGEKLEPVRFLLEEYAYLLELHGNATAAGYAAPGAVEFVLATSTPFAFNLTHGAPHEGLPQCAPCEAGEYCPQYAGVTAEPGACAHLAPGYTDPVFERSGSGGADDDLIPRTTYICECPPGHYCPTAAGRPVKCPAGTYNQKPGQTLPDACVPCAADNWNDVEGATACHICGTHATTGGAVGATGCGCVGANRVYQKGQGRCPCVGNHEYYDNDATSPTYMQPLTGDHSDDCREVTSPRCEDHLLSSNECVGGAALQAVCAVFCGGAAAAAADLNGTNGTGTGASASASAAFTLDDDLRTCDCGAATVDYVDVCDGSCQDSLPTLTCSYDDGTRVQKYTLTVIDGAAITFATLVCPAMVGACPAGGIITPVEFGAAGEPVVAPVADIDYFLGLCDPATAADQQVLVDASRRRRAERERRGDHVEAAAKPASGQPLQLAGAFSPSGGGGGGGGGARRRSRRGVEYVGVSSPLMCIESGEAMAFSVSAASYPSYAKHDALNSNNVFDDSEFVALAETMEKSSGAKPSMLTVEFKDPAGIYVFADAKNPAAKFFLRITSEGTSCDGGSIMAASPTNLKRNGAGSSAVLVRSATLFLFGSCLVLGWVVGGGW